ncbi:MAG: serine protease [Burkholderiales bacterium]
MLVSGDVGNAVSLGFIFGAGNDSRADSAIALGVRKSAPALILVNDTRTGKACNRCNTGKSTAAPVRQAAFAQNDFRGYMKKRRVAAALVIVFVLICGAFLFSSRPTSSTLSNRVVLDNLSGLPATSRIFEINVPPGATNLHFTSWRDGRIGAIDLYAKYNAAPTTDSFDAKSVGSSADKIINLPAPRAGKYYVLLRAAHGFYRGHSLVASYSLPGEPFKVGMHAHRLYNGGDWGGPPSPEPTFRYALIRDSDISHLHDAAVWKPDGSIDFPVIDKVYAAHAKNGAKVIKNFGTVPTWASMRPSERNPQYPNWPGGKSGPRNLDEYEDYVFRFVSHAKPHLWAVEGWNEPYACPHDPPEFATMTPTELADVQKRVYLATKRVDPNLLVFSPPQGYVCGIPTILGARTSQGEPISKYFDVLSWHPYNRSAKSDAGPSYAREAAEVRQHLADAGLPNMPIADSEHGWLEAPKEGGKEFYAMTDAQKGQVLYETTQLAKSLGLIAVIWYGYDNDMIGRPMNSPEISRRFQQMYDDLTVHREPKNGNDSKQ